MLDTLDPEVPVRGLTISDDRVEGRGWVEFVMTSDAKQDVCLVYTPQVAILFKCIWYATRTVRTQVFFQRVMGSKNPGETQSGSVAELYLHFFDIARDYVPPFEVFKHKLSTGRDDAGEHGIHLRWSPLQLSPEQYAEFRRELRESTTRRFEEVEAPPDVRTWDEWSWWIYTTQIHPKLPTHHPRTPSGEELAMRRRYRKALAAGDTCTADEIAAEIRQRYEPSFS